MPLILYYEEYAPKRFPKARTKRARQNIAKKLKLRLIRAGNSTLIDDEMADDDLRRLALHQQHPEPAPRRRGRPRLIAR